MEGGGGGPGEVGETEADLEASEGMGFGEHAGDDDGDVIYHEVSF